MGNLAEYLIQLDHVGVAVADLDQAIAFYQGSLGMLPIHREENIEQQVVEVMLQPAGGGALIQLLAPLSPESAIAKFLTKRGPGVQQVAYRVADVEAAAEAARSEGIRVLYPSAKIGTNQSRINFLHPSDCGGVLIELVEITEHPAAH
ncbi:MAG: methylmalonyl-CoA epimerase [Candidatus Nanopelagicales bacterium]